MIAGCMPQEKRGKQPWRTSPRRAIADEYADRVRFVLEQAERHAVEGAAHIARQIEIVSQLEGQGHDATQARALLKQFEDLQALHVADRDRLRKELEEKTD